MKANPNVFQKRAQETRDNRMGPRISAWRVEYKALRKQLPRLTPGSDKFTKAAHRLQEVTAFIDVSRYSEIREWIATLVDPELAAKVAELQTALEEEHPRVAIDVTSRFLGCDWLRDVSVCIHHGRTRLSEPTAEELPRLVTDTLRREAKALSALADIIDVAKGKRTPKHASTHAARQACRSSKRKGGVA